MQQHQEMSIRIEHARRKYPLRQVMAEHGASPDNGNWKSFKRCPFCGKDGSGLFPAKAGGGELFKCHHTSCPGGSKALDEIGFIAAKSSLSRGDACIAFLKAAGEWTEGDRTPSSVMPGKSRRKNRLPTGNEIPEEDETQKTESRDMGVPAAQPAPEGEVEPSERFEDLTQMNATAPPPTSGAEAPAVRIPYSCFGARAPETLMDANSIAPGSGSVPTDAPPSVSAPPAALSADNTGGALPVEKQKAEIPKAETGPTLPDGDGAGKVIQFEKIKSGEVKRVEAGQKPSAPSEGIGLKGEEEEKKPERDLPGEALAEFYSRLELTDADRTMLRTKRGLTDEEIDAAGFRTNREGNVEILKEMFRKWDADVLLKCGLWKMNDEHEVKPTAQFYGWGLVGKKAGGGKRKGRDEMEWGWAENGRCNPMLIPYWDAKGKLMMLRPHKGNAEGQPPRLYVARRALVGDMQCLQAVITEGEFKARGLNQVLNAGTPDRGSRWGCGAIPGISMAKNFMVWEDIKAWLKGIGARTVTVVFDNEEKGDPALAGYKPSIYKRFDADAWSGVLASRLDGEGYSTRIGHLPDEWRDANGKADWDGVVGRWGTGNA